MNIRVIILCVFVTFLVIYAWKDWFKSLCGLILLMSVMEHGDMPKSIFGIQGFNLWNVLFVGVAIAWFAKRHREGLTWDIPKHVNVLLLMYMGVILVGFLRAVFDRSYIEDYTLKSLISDELINTIKWVLPGILLFDGCRTRRRVILALTCILAMYILIAAQVVRSMPLEAAFTDSGLINRARIKLDRWVGYNACDMSTFLAGGSWGILAALPLFRKKRYWPMVLGAASVVALGQALTGGRAGYVAWGATGLTMCLLKWRKYLILAPVVVMLLPIIFPGAARRMLEGFGVIDVTGQAAIDEESLGAGRLQIWPYVVDKIAESPMIGYGRLAMKRTGLQFHIGQQTGDYAFPHPHNMYLETLLDNGILGSLPIFVLWAILVTYSGRLFMSNNNLCAAVGGLALALMLAQLFGGIGSQHVYPRESLVGTWAAMFLMLRAYVEQKKAQRDLIDSNVSLNRHALMQHQAVIASGYT